MTAESLSEAPETYLRTVTAEGDCLPDMLAARQTGPIVRVPFAGREAWVVCDPALARSALTNPHLSKDVRLIPDWIRVPGSMLAAQPPPEAGVAMVMSEGEEHTRIRRAHASAFSPRHTGVWQERISSTADELLEKIARNHGDGEEINVVDVFAYPLPITFFCEMLGLPTGMHTRMRRVTEEIIFSHDPAVRAGAVPALFSAVTACVENPSRLNDGLISDLLNRTGKEGCAASPSEVVIWSVGLVLSGWESTASLISSALYEALRRPVGARPRTEEEVEAWIEETLRVHPPFLSTTWRFATQDIGLGGYRIPHGAPVLVNLASANRDLDEPPENFEPERKGQGHISFGLGTHFCLGAPLARLEARIALSGFLSRFPQARLSEGGSVQWQSEWLTRRLSILPVRLFAGLSGSGATVLA